MNNLTLADIEILKDARKQWEHVQDNEMALNEDERNIKSLTQSIKMIKLINDSIAIGNLGDIND
jgi:hypothetical protein